MARSALLLLLVLSSAACNGSRLVDDPPRPTLAPPAVASLPNLLTMASACPT